METIGREAEFEQVLRRLESQRSSASSGSRELVHLSISAPPKGGLTTFLKDLADLLRQGRPGFVAEGTSFEFGLDERLVHERFLELGKRIGKLVGRDMEVFDIPTLFEFCKELEARGQFVVLILDVAEGIRQIATDTARASRAPLLQVLRFLVNLMHDREPPLAIIVGWDDRFPGWSADWNAQDVAMRYPGIDLWPDFGSAGWATYRRILEIRGAEITGNFPGFPRSGIPVGVVLDRLRQRGGVRIDGPFLLDLLTEKYPAAQECLNELSQPLALSALCLEDREIGKDDGELHGVVTSEAFRGMVERTPEGRIIASEELYGRLHIAPARLVLSVAHTVRKKFDEGADQELNRNVLAGIVSLFGGAIDETGSVGTIRIPGGDIGASWDLDFEVYVALERTVAESERAHHVARVAAINENIDALHTRFVILIHRSEFDGNNYAGSVLDRVRERKAECLVLKSETRTRKDGPAWFGTITLNAEQAVDATLKGRDSSYRQTADLEEHIRSGLERHRKQVAKQFPPLLPRSFSSGLLPQLITKACQRLQEAELIAAGQIDKTTANAVLRELEAAGVIGRDLGECWWKPSEDRLLQLIEDYGGSRNALARSYSLSPTHWQPLRQSFHESYGDDYIRLSTEGELEVVRGWTGMQKRAAGILESLRRQLDGLRGFSPIDVPRYRGEIEQREGRIREARGRGDLEQICEEGLKLGEEIHKRSESFRKDLEIVVEDCQTRGQELALESSARISEDLEAQRQEILGDLQQLNDRMDKDRYDFALSEDASDLKKRLVALNRSISSHHREFRNACSRVRKTLQTLNSLLQQMNEIKSVFWQAMVSHPQFPFFGDQYEGIRGRTIKVSHELQEFEHSGSILNAVEFTEVCRKGETAAGVFLVEIAEFRERLERHRSALISSGAVCIQLLKKSPGDPSELEIRRQADTLPQDSSCAPRPDGDSNTAKLAAFGEGQRAAAEANSSIVNPAPESEIDAGVHQQYSRRFTRNQLTDLSDVLRDGRYIVTDFLFEPLPKQSQPSSRA